MKPTKPYSERIVEIKDAIDTTDSIAEAKEKLGINPTRLDYTDCPRDVVEKKRPATMRQAEKWVKARELNNVENMVQKMERVGLLLRLRRLGFFIARQL